jgi:hypothetical protein
MFWTSLSIQFAMALAVLAAACWITPRSWKVQASQTSVWIRGFQSWTHGRTIARVQRRTRLLARAPFYWLACRDRFAPVWPLIFAAVTLGVTLWCIVHYEIPAEPSLVIVLACLAINDLTTRMRVAGIAATRLAEDRQTGALETVLSTPITVSDVMKGLWMAIRHIQLPGYCALFLIYVVVASVFFSQIEPTLDACLGFLISAVVSIVDFIVIGYVAMWKGMRVAHPRHAAGAALMRVVLLPWLIWMGCMPFIVEVAPVRKAFEFGEPYTFVGFGLAIWLISSITALRGARRNLRLHFRSAATDRYLFERKFGLMARLRAFSERAGLKTKTR